jgi:hypothetical protein
MNMINQLFKTAGAIAVVAVLGVGAAQAQQVVAAPVKVADAAAPVAPPAAAPVTPKAEAPITKVETTTTEEKCH